MCFLGARNTIRGMKSRLGKYTDFSFSRDGCENSEKLPREDQMEVVSFLQNCMGNNY